MPPELMARDVMTDGVIAIDQDASVQDAARKMRDENIRSLVVLEDGEAVGIVVGRDVVYNVVADNRNVADTRVEDIMTADIVTAAVDDDVEDIARAMIEHDISRVPILQGDQLVGIVTQSNMIQAWPSYVDLLREEQQLPLHDSGAGETTSTSGTCDQCENYTDDLVNVDGTFVCPECRAAL
jgi:CBS-domain-containing membrane protein